MIKTSLPLVCFKEICLYKYVEVCMSMYTYAFFDDLFVFARGKTGQKISTKPPPPVFALSHTMKERCQNLRIFMKISRFETVCRLYVPVQHIHNIEYKMSIYHTNLMMFIDFDQFYSLEHVRKIFHQIAPSCIKVEN